eukprot:TRINITY_DN8802_c0_g1_i1.p1 TRINITY_DN8802_c0_g1~~TRINITY_DN8802_c0_g1_i1.p1  ORF type:complete len:210 (+),score=56.21 TRINITY_DN8802_c0_g1_i1:103-732(+)
MDNSSISDFSDFLLSWSSAKSRVAASISITKWLKSLGLEQYEAVFLQHGYDDVFALSLMDERDFDLLHIRPAHRKKILYYSSELSRRSELFFEEFQEKKKGKKIRVKNSVSLGEEELKCGERFSSFPLLEDVNRESRRQSSEKYDALERRISRQFSASSFDSKKTLSSSNRADQISSSTQSSPSKRREKESFHAHSLRLSPIKLSLIHI